MTSAPVTAGQVLAGKYRIERVLGEGGMGVVVEALDTSLERRVAIKFLLPEFAKHPEATQRFMREARAAVKIQSEHVARVIDVSTLETGAPYIVMEFLEGSDLSQVIEAGGPLTIEDAALYLIQACEALAEAHAHGIVHRDLKPANLFLANQAGGSRKVKVLDFGISKTLAATDPGLVGSLTRTSSMMGSPLYMSPEQMKNARDVDLRADIWALGVILYETLAGRTPFEGNSIPEISAKILLEDPEPLGRVNPAVPPELAEVVSRALRKQPEMRFQNVGDLAMALLPFAPNRARNNVERIVRVLRAAGMAEGEFLASLAPDERAQLLGTPLEVLQIKNVGPTSAALLASSSQAKQGTVADFAHTQTERARPRGGARRMVLAALASVCTLAAAAVLLARSGGGATPSPSAVAAAPTAVDAPPTAAPPASVAPLPAGDTPAEQAAAPTDDTADPAATPAAGSEAAAEKAVPAPPQPKAEAPRSATSAKKAPRTQTTTAKKPRTAKSKQAAVRADFKTKFGSRK